MSRLTKISSSHSAITPPAVSLLQQLLLHATETLSAAVLLQLLLSVKNLPGNQSQHHPPRCGGFSFPELSRQGELAASHLQLWRPSSRGRHPGATESEREEALQADAGVS